MGKGKDLTFEKEFKEDRGGKDEVFMRQGSFIVRSSLVNQMKLAVES